MPLTQDAWRTALVQSPSASSRDPQATPRTRIIHPGSRRRATFASGWPSGVCRPRRHDVRRPTRSPARRHRREHGRWSCSSRSTITRRPIRTSNAPPRDTLRVEGPLGSFGLPSPFASATVVHRRRHRDRAAALDDVGNARTESERHISRHLQRAEPEEFAYRDELDELAAQGRIDLRLTITREARAEWTGRPRSHRRRAHSIDAEDEATRGR